MKREAKITYCGVTKNVTEWAKFFGVTKGAISVRMKEHDESYEQAVSYFAHRSPSAARPKANTRKGLDLLAAIFAELKKMNIKLGGLE